MKYLVAVDDCFLDRPGGMGRVAWDIAQVAREHAHDVTLLSFLLPGEGSATTVDHQQGIRIVRYAKPLLRSWHLRRAARTIAAAAQAVRETIAHEHWDLVHMHTPYTGAGALDALGSRPRYIYTMHSPIVLEQQINWKGDGWKGHVKRLFGMRRLLALEGRLLRACSDIHTLSEFTRRWVEHFHGLSHRVTVIPYWRRSELQRTMSKAEARQRLGWPQNEKILFTVRGLNARTGVDVAIQAIAPLATANRCMFYIGGDGALRSRLDRTAAELGASERIRFLGRMSDEDLFLAYQAADLFVLPTIALECFGLISIEAMSFGCPVIATQAGAIPEVLYPILPNCLVPPADVESLRDKIAAFLDGRLSMPDEAELLTYIDQNYGQDVIVPRLMRLLESPARLPVG